MTLQQSTREADVNGEKVVTAYTNIKLWTRLFISWIDKVLRSVIKETLSKANES